MRPFLLTMVLALACLLIVAGCTPAPPQSKPDRTAMMTALDAAWTKADWTEAAGVVRALRSAFPNDQEIAQKFLATLINAGDAAAARGDKPQAAALYLEAGDGRPGPNTEPRLQALTPTAVPPPPPAAARPAEADVRFTSVVGGPPGGTASVAVQTAPNASCSIKYITPRGTDSTAQGLIPKTADASGRVSWSWVIGTATQPGTGRVTVTCGGASATAPIQIG
jgi:hypothetical protein